MVISYFVIGCLLSIPRPFPAPIFPPPLQSCLVSGAQRRRGRSVPSTSDAGGTTEGGTRKEATLTLSPSLLYLGRRDRCRSLSRCEGRTEKWGKWEGKEGRERGSVRFPRSTERRWDDASDVGRLSVGRSTVALRRASPVSLPSVGAAAAGPSRALARRAMWQ